MEMCVAFCVREFVSYATMRPVATNRSAATMASVFICEMKGLSPMKGRRKSVRCEADSFALGFLMEVEAALSFWMPERVLVVAAGMLVSVEAWPAAPGRAGAIFFFSPPVMRLNQSENEDFGFIVCAFAMGSSLLRAYFQEPLLANERGQIELEPACAAGIGVCAGHPRGCVGRPRRGRELFGVAKPQHSRHEQARAADQPVGDEDHAPLHPGGDRVASLEGGKVEHAVEVPADVRHAAEPRVREGHGHRLRDRDHLVHLVQRDEPVLRADLEAELGGERRARGSGADALGNRKLELAKSGASCHGLSSSAP